MTQLRQFTNFAHYVDFDTTRAVDLNYVKNNFTNKTESTLSSIRDRLKAVSVLGVSNFNTNVYEDDYTSVSLEQSLGLERFENPEFESGAHDNLW